jgi:anti-anti-sigma factor
VATTLVAPGLDDVHVEQPGLGTAVVVFSGEHDLATVDEVEELLRRLIDGNELVVADFSDAQFVDSSMLWVLKRANDDAQAKGRSFLIQLGTADIVRRTFEVGGFFAMLEIVPTREAATHAHKGDGSWTTK